MKRRYAVDPPRGFELLDLKPPRSGPWVGRGWVSQDPVDDVWIVTIEPDGEHAISHACATALAAAETVLADSRVSEFNLWAPERRDFVRYDRAQWIEFVSQLRADA